MAPSPAHPLASTAAAPATSILPPTPSAGSKFSAWSGACTGTAITCSVTMSAAKTVTASFVPVKLLTV
ncbi:InlB B-repeat-containing protein, partial [Methyloglobulus sp.]|uniref:InlB B-repeat-containing protein n=1 Tax=Methyloglobulus sp. TaxID=2518622 RepID=UPI003988CB27